MQSRRTHQLLPYESHLQVYYDFVGAYIIITAAGCNYNEASKCLGSCETTCKHMISVIEVS